MVECAGLEIRYTVIPYRGFESLLLRQEIPTEENSCSAKDPSTQVHQSPPQQQRALRAGARDDTRREGLSRLIASSCRTRKVRARRRRRRCLAPPPPLPVWVRHLSSVPRLSDLRQNLRVAPRPGEGR